LVGGGRRVYSLEEKGKKGGYFFLGEEKRGCGVRTRVHSLNVPHREKGVLKGEEKKWIEKGVPSLIGGERLLCGATFFNEKRGRGDLLNLEPQSITEEKTVIPF